LGAESGLAFPSSSAGIDNTIVESWSRCGEAGIDPGNTPLRRISDDDLQRRLNRNRLLVEITAPHLKWLSASMAEIQQAVYIVDGDGIVLDSVTSDGTGACEVGLEPGFDWSERSMGTNGAGTALAANRPVAIVRHEHFSCMLDGWTCTAAPIHGPDGEVIGAIDMSTTAPGSVSERVVLVAYAASMIERDLAWRVKSELKDVSTDFIDGASAERLRVLEQSEREVRSREMALATAAHEIRSPLQLLRLEMHLTILKASSMKELGPTASEWLQKHLHKISSGIDQLEGLLNDFLDVSLATEGKLNLRPELIDLGDTVRDLVANFQKQRREDRPQIRFDLTSGIVGMWDKMRIRQIVVNLLDNAVKHSRGELVDIVVSSDTARAYIEVRDNGIGIDQRHQERIFKPFETTGNTPGKGSGLGLWIISKLIAAMRGRVFVISEVGLGTTFRVELPREVLSN